MNKMCKFIDENLKISKNVMNIMMCILSIFYVSDIGKFEDIKYVCILSIYTPLLYEITKYIFFKDRNKD